jgi:hypothetical protein
MRCPNCRIEVDHDTEVCHCGHHFISRVSKEVMSGQIDPESCQIIQRNINPIAILAALEGLGTQQDNLHMAIADLVDVLKMLPEGEARDRLLVAISSLDAISENIKRALDSCGS